MNNEIMTRSNTPKHIAARRVAVKRMREKGVSQRNIAKTLGWGRGTIWADCQFLAREEIAIAAERKREMRREKAARQKAESRRHSAAGYIAFHQ